MIGMIIMHVIWHLRYVPHPSYVNFPTLWFIHLLLFFFHIFFYNFVDYWCVILQENHFLSVILKCRINHSKQLTLANQKRKKTSKAIESCFILDQFRYPRTMNQNLLKLNYKIDDDKRALWIAQISTILLNNDNTLLFFAISVAISWCSHRDTAIQSYMY